MMNLKGMTNFVVEKIKKLHGSRYFYPVLAVVGFCLASFVVLYIGSAPPVSKLNENDISLKTIYAPYTFTYPTGVNEEKTEKIRKERESAIPPVYDIDQATQDRIFVKLDNFFESVKELQKSPEDDLNEKRAVLQSGTDIALSDRDMSEFLKARDADRIRKISKDALENVFLAGIVKAENKEALQAEKSDRVTVRNPRFNIERTMKPGQLLTQEEAVKVVYDSLDRMIPENRPLRLAVYNLIKNDVAVNAFFNPEETRARKAKARESVPPIYNMETVKKNELIVEKGQRLSADAIAKLSQITRVHSIVNRTSYLSGLYILLLLLVFMAGVYLAIFEKAIVRSSKKVLFITINTFLVLVVSLVLIQAHQPAYLIPLAALGMILVVFLNVNVAFIMNLALSLYLGFMAGGKLEVSFVLFAGCAVGIYVARGARKRSTIFFAGFLVSLMNFIAIAGIGFVNNAARETIMKNGFYGLANGIISSFIVIGLLPVFEYIFGLVTNVTLLELSDLSNPLLKELTVKAPGTYHHSILVGNLAEEACNSIGANSLLARVGAYYHDIGKIEKAEYFVENEMGTQSKHEKLTPSMSALVITNHPKDGIEIAKRYKLNSAIMDFINQHHGTSLIYYFYQKALEKVKSEDELKEEEFRYPGPRPQTKETAIVLLADSVEASSRMLSDPTPARIRGLVQKIINNKFIDGQLDECDLTLKDLHKIAESFARVLTGIFHTRLEYPEVKSRKERQNALKNKNKQSK